MASMITAATWVPRGFAAPFPTKYEFDESEFDRIAELAKLQLDDAKEDLEEAQSSKEKSGDTNDSDAVDAGNDDVDKKVGVKEEYVTPCIAEVVRPH
jgi:periodic tryptophan protein 1